MESGSLTPTPNFSWWTLLGGGWRPRPANSLSRLARRRDADHPFGVRRWAPALSLARPRWRRCGCEREPTRPPPPVGRGRCWSRARKAPGRRGRRWN